MDELFETDDDPPVPEGGLLRMLPIINRRGLHARASAKFVQTVERYDAAVTVTRAGRDCRWTLDHGVADPGCRHGHAYRRDGRRPGCRRRASTPSRRCWRTASARTNSAARVRRPCPAKCTAPRPGSARQAGFRAVQVSRPCRNSQTWAPSLKRSGTVRARPSATASTVGPGASGIRFETRNTCVSTAITGSWKAKFAVTSALLRPMPGRRRISAAAARDGAAVVGDQGRRELDDVARLRRPEPDRPDDLGDPRLSQVQHAGRIPDHREQRVRDAGDGRAGGLGREQHGHEQAKRIGVVEPGLRVRIRGLESGEHGRHAIDVARHRGRGSPWRRSLRRGASRTPCGVSRAMRRQLGFVRPGRQAARSAAD